MSGPGVVVGDSRLLLALGLATSTMPQQPVRFARVAVAQIESQTVYRST